MTIYIYRRLGSKQQLTLVAKSGMPYSGHPKGRRP
jgi:hypothetical protein